MKHLCLILTCSSSVLSIHSALAVNPIAERFTTIAARNAFHLNPLAPIIGTTPPPNRSKVSLQGVTTILGRPLVLLTIEPFSKSPGFSESSCLLAQGDSRFEVVVLEIDVKLGTVRLNNLGEEQILVLKH